MSPLQATDPRFSPPDPELYDLIHRGNPGDVDFYRRICRGGARVLELGCGSGRIACALAAAGCRVVGLDHHPGMLRAAARRAAGLEPETADRLCWIEADMAAFALERRFDRVLIPYNGLYCLLDDAAVSACLRAAREHLAPGGRLVLDGYRMFTPAECEAQDDADPVDQLTDGERRIAVYEQADWDPPAQRIDAWYSYHILGPDGSNRHRYCIPQRYLLADQLDALLAAAGWRTVARYGDFDQQPFDDQSETLIAVAAPREEEQP